MQLEQLVAEFAVEYFPLRQFSQTPDNSYFPGVQAVHADSPCVAAPEPVAQALQAVHFDESQ
jgi:hypothetical protein